MREPEEPIPSVKLANEEVWRSLLPQLEDLVLNGRFILGPEVEGFEKAAATKFGASWCVGTSSGTSALVLALRAADLPRDSRVAVPANTFFATFEAIIAADLRPVLMDHDTEYLIDLDALKTADIAAVIPVHLYGLPVDMERLMRLADEKGWWVLEDCAQAHGATIGDRSVGSFGYAGAFSAYPTKNLGAWGDAGFVVGESQDIEAKVRALRHHGQVGPNEHERLGGTDRLDNLQALVLTEKLARLDDEVKARRRVAAAYREALSNLPLDLPDDRGPRHHSYHQFVIRVPDRDRIRAEFLRAGISTAIHYPRPLHRQPAAAGLFATHGPLERAETWNDEILSLPIYPGLSDAAVGRVATVLGTAMGGS